MSIVDPVVSRGRWLVVTASGARHLIDASKPGGSVTVVRVVPAGVATEVPFPVANLRRDGAAIRVWSINHPVDDEVCPGVAVGRPMLLGLEPLDPAASTTVRLTTPVVSIHRLDHAPPAASRSLGLATGRLGSPAPHAADRPSHATAERPTTSAHLDGGPMKATPDDAAVPDFGPGTKPTKSAGFDFPMVRLTGRELGAQRPRCPAVKGQIRDVLHPKDVA